MQASVPQAFSALMEIALQRGLDTKLFTYFLRIGGDDPDYALDPIMDGKVLRWRSVTVGVNEVSNAHGYDDPGALEGRAAGDENA